MRLTRSILVPLLCLHGPALFAADEAKRPRRDTASFGILRAVSPEEARARAEAWLLAEGKAQAMPALNAIWQRDRGQLEKVAETLALGDPLAAKLLADARDPDTPAPTTVPTILKDAKQTPFYRANLALAYAKALANRRIYEEGLEALKVVRAEDVVDQAS
ncbi:MAG: hypothetical protein ACRD36_02355, partial [Candidatus Acidiferrum sp.]